jgi:hypothetical protein
VEIVGDCFNSAGERFLFLCKSPGHIFAWNKVYIPALLFDKIAKSGVVCDNFVQIKLLEAFEEVTISEGVKKVLKLFEMLAVNIVAIVLAATTITVVLAAAVVVAVVETVLISHGSWKPWVV